VKTSLGISRLEAGRSGDAGGDEEKQQRSASMGKAYLPECAKSKGIRLLVNMPTRLGTSGPSGDPTACGV
jgi:hypothetical protein